MSLRPGEEIGEEMHSDGDQFFRPEKGRDEIWIDGVMSRIKSEMAMIVPAGARHNVKNTGDKSLRLYTIYSPPGHLGGAVFRRKSEAHASTEHFDETTTEA